VARLQVNWSKANGGKRPPTPPATPLCTKIAAGKINDIAKGPQGRTLPKG
jgi:hypothetical protein